MPLIEYFLLALMAPGAAAAGTVPDSTPRPILGADAIAQPTGGALSVGFGHATPKKGDAPPARPTRRHRRPRGNRPVKRAYAPKKDGGT